MKIVDERTVSAEFVEPGDIFITEIGSHILMAFDDHNGWNAFVYLDEAAELRHYDDKGEKLQIGNSFRGNKIISIVKRKNIQIILNS